MVLDTSGSMIASYNDSGMTRIEAMKDSVNLFINSLEKSNSEDRGEFPEIQSRNYYV